MNAKKVSVGEVGGTLQIQASKVLHQFTLLSLISKKSLIFWAEFFAAFWHSLRMLKVFWIANPLYIYDKSGEGARLHGGRWNAVGTPVLYTAEKNISYAYNV
ncbi:RES family NAD+ phosphorylase [Dyadobacter sp. CY107]|uniref:RES family NAD+ phosphorylase n=1 Tax=Dyadobacter fanqingshengii TaxID=2906443 RepID=UPI001F338504|nr:RES family NAD+ phosphorylase [Dyadobacter fanqingshengii]MCF2501919.1 RES family NAD+ phosphorylase [Dyadobacter fanqingshengii]